MSILSSLHTILVFLLTNYNKLNIFLYLNISYLNYLLFCDSFINVAYLTRLLIFHNRVI